MEEYFNVSSVEKLPRYLRNIDERYHDLFRQLKELEDLEEDSEDVNEEIDIIKCLINQYQEIFVEMREKIRTMYPMKDLAKILYCGFLFNVRSEAEMIEEEAFKDRERSKMEVLEHDEKVTLANVGNIFLPRVDRLRHGKGLAECWKVASSFCNKDDPTYISERGMIDRILGADDLSTRNIKKYIPGSAKEDKWRGGTLHQWIKGYREGMVVELSFPRGGLPNSENRLTDTARLIIRRLMDEVRKLHLIRQATTETLSTTTILLDKGLGVRLSIHPDTIVTVGEADFKKNYLDLAIVIEEIIGDVSIPKDVSHLLALLRDRYDSEDRYLIFHHSCLWTQVETIKNIFMFRLACKIQHGLIAQGVENNYSHWASTVHGHTLYMKSLTSWVKDIRRKKQLPVNDDVWAVTNGQFDLHPQAKNLISNPSVLSFMRMVIHHAQDAMCSNAKKGPDGKRQRRMQEKTEEDMFLLFPTYIPEFMVSLRNVEQFRDIYTSTWDT